EAKIPAAWFAVPVTPEVEFEAWITPYVIITGIIVPKRGLMFGYDVKISGGVTSMDDILEKFFPVVYCRKHELTGNENVYCKYENEGIQLFTSSLYLTRRSNNFAYNIDCFSWGQFALPYKIPPK
ncbi:hypothetical protein KI387_012396, partial [Taxus chinensis]